MRAKRAGLEFGLGDPFTHRVPLPAGSETPGSRPHDGTLSPSGFALASSPIGPIHVARLLAQALVHSVLTSKQEQKLQLSCPAQIFSLFKTIFYMIVQTLS